MPKKSKKIEVIQKPEPTTNTYYDYYECAAFISQKLGYDIDDHDYWGFLCDHRDVSNGGYITLPDEDEGTEEQQTITKAFNEEFGDGFEVDYLTSW